MADSNADQKFLQLRQQYIQGLPQRIRQIRTAWDRLRHVSWDAKVLNYMVHAVHKLTGSGSTFHFPAITIAAGALEKRLEDAQLHLEANALERQQITDALARLERAIDDAVANGDQAASPATETRPTDRGEFHIAVIEDDPDQAAQLDRGLADLGYTVHTFADPEAYSRHAKERAYQMILLDVSFPQGPLEGLVWLDRLRSHVGSKVPVAIMSARTDMVARMRALQAGADVFLTKPLDMDFLARRIEQIHETTRNVRPRVLWVDDDKDLLDYYQDLLTDRGYEADTLSQSVRLLERIEQFEPDVIVLDYQMPGCNGFELARILRQDPRYMTIPLIFVSASRDLETRHRQDSIVGNAYFQKPLDDEAFLQCLQAQIMKAQLIGARIDLLSQRHGPSGLQNQDYFINRLEQRMASLDPGTTSSPYYLLQLAIDNEEYLKARHGMRTMLNLNGQLESYLASHSRIHGRGCNLGGGYFLLLFDIPQDQSAGSAIEQFHAELNRQRWSPGQDTKPVTLAMGVMHLDHAQDLDQVLGHVESACAQALKTGGGSLEWHREESAANHSGLTDQVRSLIDARAFTLHFQPVMNMDNEETLSEALIRLVDDDQVVYMPHQFLPWLPAGNRGNFYELDRWVIESAVASLVQLQGRASASQAVIVKLSSPLEDVEQMQPFITNVIRGSGIKGQRRIYFAFSVPIVVKDVPRARKLFRTLQELGCGVIIEHVTPDSNIIQMLRDVGPVDFVKLSSELGRHSEQTAELYGFINELHDFLGSTPIIVTGVEDARVLSRFWERGIRYFQGYFIQKPGLTMQYSAAT
ncbi:response regulator [Marinobacter halodurans]|uniref:Response regulator n=1 Tax=Marinobacter halodurans TaxID=2528979 RepID=A0ABY1ZLC1_9GAMM|nr:response regulator [Marinobacter halodurans]TBW55144.1 response regulator [Marinobacter halodurans]